MTTILCHKGLQRQVREGVQLVELISEIHPPIEVDFSGLYRENRSSNIGGHLWVKYGSIAAAETTKRALHSRLFCGTYLSVKFEFGIDTSGRRVLKNINNHTTKIRVVALKNTNNKTKFSNSFDYSSHSIVVNNTSYPFPTGLYLTRIIELQSRWRNGVVGATTSDDFLCFNRLLDFVTCLSIRDADSSTDGYSNQYSYFDSSRVAKELTEAMAMVDAIFRSLKMMDLMRCTVSNVSEMKANDQIVGTLPVRVFVLGDGVYPLCTALIALHFPSPSWQYYSIDPMLKPIIFPPDTSELGISTENSLRNRFHQVSDISQNFSIPFIADAIKIVISCHSHAPLQEFWDRLPAGGAEGDSLDRSIAISMPCCAKFGILFESAASKGMACEANDVLTEEPICDDYGFKSTRVCKTEHSIAEKKRLSKKQRRNIKFPVRLEPLLQFDDFEVYSPKRTVLIYTK